MPMVKAQGKSGFLKELFVDDPTATKATIDDAWRKAGNDDSVSTSLISKVRAELGLTTKGRAKAKRSKDQGRHSPAAPQAQSRRNPPKATNRGPVKRKNPSNLEHNQTKKTHRAGNAVQTQAMIELEHRIDELIHKARVAGGLAQFEDELRKARRLLARLHAD